VRKFVHAVRNRLWHGQHEASAREARYLIPQALSQVSATDNSNPATWTHRRLLRTMSDALVFAIGADDGPAEAYFKLAHSDAGIASLKRQGAFASELRQLPGLQEWSAVVPTTLTSGEGNGRYYVV